MPVSHVHDFDTPVRCEGGEHGMAAEMFSHALPCQNKLKQEARPNRTGNPKQQDRPHIHEDMQ